MVSVFFLIRDYFPSLGHLSVALAFSLVLNIAMAAPAIEFEDFQLTASDAVAGQYFGSSLAVDGDTLVVGAPLDDRRGEDSGSVYIYERLGSTWFETARFSGGESSANDQFGYSVALLGDILLVGAPFDSDEGSRRGSAYFFQRTRSGWLEVARVTSSDAANNDLFGFAVDLGIEIAVISALWDDDRGSASGSAYIFELNNAGWVQTDKLLANDGTPGDQFGYDVALTDSWVVVGARWADSMGEDSGSSYVFERGFGAWTQMARLNGSNSRGGDEFGYSVDISGNQLVVGARLSDARCPDGGAAYVFEFTGFGWQQSDILYASDPAPGDQLGCGVSISPDGVLVGAWRDDANQIDAGSVYLFEGSSGSLVDTTRFIAIDGRHSDYLGCAVGRSGDLLAAGAPYNDDAGESSGAAYLFNIVNSNPQPAAVFGSSFEN